MKLSVGSTYQLYTSYESISGIKVKIVGTLAYSECESINYNMTTLAINERQISTKEESLEDVIGTDTIYWCKSTEANADGSYSNYLVWDSIINFNKTKKINKSYKYTLNLSILDTINIPITQVISGIEKYISTNYAKVVSATIEAESANDSDTETETTTAVSGITDEQIDRVEAILTKIASFETRLIPAAEKITSLNLSDSLDNISDKVAEINNNVNVIAQQV